MRSDELHDNMAKIHATAQSHKPNRASVFLRRSASRTNIKTQRMN
ncbi:hypothetical protein BV349_03823 [Pseudomonas syringae pv. actinidiae]|nr:hypothetical protein BV349_03823 [Pseudomonas syringae pv. actinidiae]OSN74905.1 hypothetical protein BV351_04128 [Pseudomonas syringae pv. actinidiae]